MPFFKKSAINLLLPGMLDCVPPLRGARLTDHKTDFSAKMGASVEAVTASRAQGMDFFAVACDDIESAISGERLVLQERILLLADGKTCR